MDKRELREKYKAVRLGMAKDEEEQKSRTICEKLLDELAGQKFEKIHIYKSLPSLHEVDTKSLLNQLVEYGSKVTVTLGESDKNAPLPQQQFDLIIVPCLAFDKNCYRLGWGGGWYDRFLADQPQALKIGLCFQSGLVPGNLPREPHDVQLDKVITEV